MPESAHAGDRAQVPEPRQGRYEPDHGRPEPPREQTGDAPREDTAREDTARDDAARDDATRERTARRPEPVRADPNAPGSDRTSPPGEAAGDAAHGGVDRPRLGEYRTELVRRVQPVVERDVSLIAAELRRESGAPVDVSVRAATAETLVERAATIGRREGRSVAGTDVPDALGARITVADPGQLTALVDRVRQRYAGGPAGRILTIDEDLAHAGGGPEGAAARDVRVTVGTENSGRPYAFTLWLAARSATRDASRDATRDAPRDVARDTPRAAADWFRLDHPPTGLRDNPPPPPEDRHA